MSRPPHFSKLEMMSSRSRDWRDDDGKIGLYRSMSIAAYKKRFSPLPVKPKTDFSVVMTDGIAFQRQASGILFTYGRETGGNFSAYGQRLR